MMLRETSSYSVLSVCGWAVFTAMAVWSVPAGAQGLESSVSVRGTSSGGEVEAESEARVGIAAAAPALEVTIAAEPEGEAAAGDTIVLTYRILNSGNVTLSGLKLTSAQNGGGEWQAATPEADAAVDRLAPGDAATFVGRYTVVPADIERNGVDGLAIATEARAEARYRETVVAAQASRPLDIEPVRATLAVTKTPDRNNDVAAGDVITYSYEVTNTGNVAISAVTLVENHGGAGPAPVPGDERLVEDAGVEGDSRDEKPDGIWDLLGPGDRVLFTGTYTVTQADVDELQ